ncbi:MAG: hypothetical protein KJ939_03585 [Nanoarchaeota archaeon]|nr:hypothetical protein [Nanoarchaeota archaeon]
MTDFKTIIDFDEMREHQTIIGVQIIEILTPSGLEKFTRNPHELEYTLQLKEKLPSKRYRLKSVSDRFGAKKIEDLITNGAERIAADFMKHGFFSQPYNGLRFHSEGQVDYSISYPNMAGALFRDLNITEIRALTEKTADSLIRLGQLSQEELEFKLRDIRTKVKYKVLD